MTENVLSSLGVPVMFTPFVPSALQNVSWERSSQKAWYKRYPARWALYQARSSATVSFLVKYWLACAFFAQIVMSMGSLLACRLGRSGSPVTGSFESAARVGSATAKNAARVASASNFAREFVIVFPSEKVDG